MKVFAIPAVVAGLTAGLSLLFFVGISQQFGDAALGEIVMVQAVAAMVLMLFLPQCWVYIIAARDPEELKDRYRRSLTIEIAGIACGAVALAVLLLLPINLFENWQQGAHLIYLSLAIQGMTSCMGWLRATESWVRYAIWNIGSNLIRVPLIWATPLFAGTDVSIYVHESRSGLFLVYFLIPDLIRLTGVALPIVVRNYRWPGFSRAVESLRIVLRNWLFDFGSTINETADRLVVGLILGPNVLVTYFLARRLAIAVSMVTEPFYIEHYRRFSAISVRDLDRRPMQKIYAVGAVLAIGVAVVVSALIYAGTQIPFIVQFMPDAIASMILVFSGVLLVDSLIAANRWSRFVTQLDGGAQQLLVVRVLIFSFFCLGVFWFGDAGGGLGVVLALAVSCLFEATYLTFRIARFGR